MKSQPHLSCSYLYFNFSSSFCKWSSADNQTKTTEKIENNKKQSNLISLTHKCGAELSSLPQSGLDQSAHVNCLKARIWII